MLKVTSNISISEDEIHLDFVRSPGPGGQKVNKTSSAVQLRFDVSSSASLPHEVKDRLLRIARGSITTGGELIIVARRLRTQPQNRKDAIDRLVNLVRRAAIPPTPRVKTRPTRASRQRRLAGKLVRSRIKQSRRTVSGDGD